ncbi:MAG: AI-2E family transporter [Planctomycetota bacterium]|nr:MAG: AI-2E family transporter [Planctomycetota bacterium]
MTRLISFIVLLAIIFLVGLLFYKVLINFFVPLFLAGVVVVVFHPVHQWMLEKTGGREKLAAGLTTAVAALVLLIPFPFAVYAAVQGVSLMRENDAQTIRLRIEHIRDELGLQMPPYYPDIQVVEREIDQLITSAHDVLLTEEDPRLSRLTDRILRSLDQLQIAVAVVQGDRWQEEFSQLRELVQRLKTPADESEATLPLTPSQLAVEIKGNFSRLRAELLGGGFMALARELANPTPEDIEGLLKGAIQYARPQLMSITGATGGFLIRSAVGFVVMILAAFFFFYDGPAMLQAAMKMNPLDDEYERELLAEFDRISRAVVLATVLSAISQGLVAGVGYYFAGLDYWLLLMMLTGLFAMVPFVGPAIVWVPVALYVGLYEGNMTAAIGLAVWGTLAVGSIDNVVKIYALQGQSRLHPLLALLSVLGGIQALGPIGIVIGPMAVALLQTLLSILQRELLHFDETLARTGSPLAAPAADVAADSTAATASSSRWKWPKSLRGQAGSGSGEHAPTAETAGDEVSDPPRPEPSGPESAAEDPAPDSLDGEPKNKDA